MRYPILQHIARYLYDTPPKKNTKEFCDTIATSIARYEKYRCWASKSVDGSSQKGLAGATPDFVKFLGSGKPNQSKVSSWTFCRGTPEQKFNVSRACYPKEKHQNWQKKGEIHELFVLALSCLWLAEATPDEISLLGTLWYFLGKWLPVLDFTGTAPPVGQHQ